jgi:hypothetical protein
MSNGIVVGLRALQRVKKLALQLRNRLETNLCHSESDREGDVCAISKHTRRHNGRVYFPEEKELNPPPIDSAQGSTLRLPCLLFAASVADHPDASFHTQLRYALTTIESKSGECGEQMKDPPIQSTIGEEHTLCRKSHISKKEQSMQIFVKTLTGKTITLERITISYTAKHGTVQRWAIASTATHSTPT